MSADRFQKMQFARFDHLHQTAHRCARGSYCISERNETAFRVTNFAKKLEFEFSAQNVKIAAAARDG